MTRWPTRVGIARFVAALGLAAGAASAVAAPANDYFVNRIALGGSVIVYGSNLGATNETSEPVHAGEPGDASVWWSWTASQSGSVTMTTLGSEFDTLLAVYTGSTLASLIEVASNDDATLTNDSSRVTFNALAGAVYQIAVDGYTAAQGNIRLSILENDHFTDRVTLTGASAVAAGHNVGATGEAGEPLHAGRTPAKSVWWNWFAPTNGSLALRLSGDNTTVEGGVFYKLLEVYAGSSLSNLVHKAGSGANFALTNLVTLDVVAGVNYAIVADGVAGASGALLLDLTFTPAPPNDHFASRSPLSGPDVSVTGSNVGATKENDEPNHAGDVGGHSVWWSWAAPAGGSVAIEISGGLSGKLLAVYAGTTLPGLTGVRSNFTTEATNRLTLDVTPGVNYAIAVDGFGGQVGSISLRLQFSSGPANDFFVDRSRVEGVSFIAPGSNVGAGAEPGEPNHGGYPATRSVWWQWTAPVNGILRLTASGDNISSGGGPFYKLIGVYSGATLAALVTNRLSSGLLLTNSATLDVAAGATYQVAVDGHNGASGNFTVGFTLTPSPGNDSFASRISLSNALLSVAGSNIAAGKEPGEPNHAGPGGRSVWWSWRAPASGSVTISTAGSTFNTLLAVYTGGAVNALSAVASNNDFGGTNTSQVTFNATAGVVYQVAVDGFLGASGSILLNITQDVCLLAITCPANLQTNTTDQCGQIVTFAPSVAADCTLTNMTCVPASGSEFVIGVTTVTCTARDSRGSTATCSFTVSVSDNSRPVLSTQPQSQDVNAGATANFSVTASACSTLGYQWLFEGSEMPGKTESILVIPTAQPGHAGKYAVRVTSAGGSVTSMVATLTVNQPPLAHSDGAISTGGQPVLITFQRLLANDTDPDGDSLAVISAGASSAAGGVVGMFADHVSYSAPAAFAGTDSFGYTVTDGRGGVSAGTVEVYVGTGELPAANHLSISRSGSELILRFAGAPGATYRLLRSPGVNGPWDTIATGTARAHGIVEHTDREPPWGAGIYRMALP